MTAPNKSYNNGVVCKIFETDLNCIHTMLNQANFAAEIAIKLWDFIVHKKYVKYNGQSRQNEPYLKIQ